MKVFIEKNNRYTYQTGQDWLSWYINTVTLVGFGLAKLGKTELWHPETSIFWQRSNSKPWQTSQIWKTEFWTILNFTLSSKPEPWIHSNPPKISNFELSNTLLYMMFGNGWNSCKNFSHNFQVTISSYTHMYTISSVNAVSIYAEFHLCGMWYIFLR